MALLDVSDILDDPDFVDSVTLCRSAVVTGENGRSTATRIETTIIGVVTQGGGDDLDRTGDAQKIKGSITVHTVSELSAGSPTAAPDEVVWQGRRYIVDSVADWSNLGAGYWAASCVLKSVTGGAP